MTGASQPGHAALVDCERCPRLAAALRDTRATHPGWHARPVPAFGVSRPRLLVVGLAPGFQGANRTGRPFTGDWAGELLYATLHRHGFSTAPVSSARDDGLALIDARITNAVKCWPPANRPLPAEVRACNAWLVEELAALDAGSVVLALGQVAHGAVLRARVLRAADHPFAHGAQHTLGGRLELFDSYHCSRYNVNTKRLDAAMFDRVFVAIRARLAP